MTDTQTDDDIIEIRSSNNKPTTTSSITTSRRPMFIETEIRTDTVTTRRMAAAANRSVQDVLENTKSPIQDRQSTTYTYAQTSSYVSSSNANSCDAPVMARRDLHDENQNTTTSKLASMLFLPSLVFSNVRSQLSNGYDTVRNGLSHLAGCGQETATTTDSAEGQLIGGSSRSTRSSSQSSASGSRATGYNLRSRPVHSTSQENETEQGAHHRKGATRHKKDHENPDDEEETDEHKQENSSPKCLQHAICCSKKLVQLPIVIFDCIWSKLKSLPIWLLIPLLIFVSLYALPLLACKPFERYHHAKVNEMCRQVEHHTKQLPIETSNFFRRHVYECGVRNVKRVYRSTIDVKDAVLNSLNNAYTSSTKCIRDTFLNVKVRVISLFEKVAGKTVDSYDAGVEKVKSLIEELKQEREKLLGQRSSIKPEQEKELVEIVRKMLDEYAADEVGQADYALEANGGKVVDVRCQEYTDEPRQNVVKFLGIPIIHMSKHPEIIIKHGRMPGQCFPFKGNHGSIVIRLAAPIKPTEFVMEHLPKSISIVGHVNSAPNNFTVYALKDKHDKEGVVLGRYYYDAENGPAIQRFKPQASHVSVIEYVEIQISSNWGNPAYTCLYRFRVHGDLQSGSSTAV